MDSLSNLQFQGLPLDISVIIPNQLHLGGFSSILQQNKGNLEKYGIQAILSAGSFILLPDPREYETMVIPVEDILFEPLYKYFEKCYGFIEAAINAEKPVFVHCAAGVSRSAAIVMMYLMKKNQWTRDFTFKFVLEKRAIVSPNTGFMQQLLAFEASNFSFDIRQIEQNMEKMSELVWQYFGQNLEALVSQVEDFMDLPDPVFLTKRQKLYSISKAILKIQNELEVFKNEPTKDPHRQQIQENLLNLQNKVELAIQKMSSGSLVFESDLKNQPDKKVDLQ